MGQRKTEEEKLRQDLIPGQWGHAGFAIKLKVNKLAVSEWELRIADF